MGYHDFLINRLQNSRIQKQSSKVRQKILFMIHKQYDDKRYLSLIYKRVFKHDLDFDNPKTFNEKLQWLKIYWFDSRAIVCADKLAVRKYIKDQGFGFLLNDLIAVYDDASSIDLTTLPNKFVLKCTHGSGCNVICEDKTQLDWSIERKMLSNWLRKNYFWNSREWVYKEIVPRIICEKYIKSNDGKGLPDYKFFCFNGRVEYIMLGLERFSESGLKVDFYDRMWNKMPYTRDHAGSENIHQKPCSLNTMIEYAEKLSKPFPFVRIDFYDVRGKIIFGEFTFFPGGGFEAFQPNRIDFEWGSKLDLKNIKDKTYQL